MAIFVIYYLILVVVEIEVMKYIWCHTVGKVELYIIFAAPPPKQVVVGP